MPNTGNFSDPEKRRAPDPLHIHDDFNAARLPASLLVAAGAKCDFVRKGFSCVRQTDNAG